MATVFITGATGVLGRATIPLLLAKGYAVRALSRSAENDAAIRAMGAEPVRGSLFETGSLAAAMAGADAVLHLATRIPPSSQARRRAAWRENDRIRAEGTRNLVDAALASGVTVFVYPSFAFVYPDSGDAWIDAASTPTAPVDMMASTTAAEREAARFAAADASGERRGVALRLGGLYGSDLPSTREQLQLARHGLSQFAGSPEGFIPPLWIGDAATALIAALERAPSGLYDVVDDEPLRHRDLNDALAKAAGRRRLFAPPGWMIRLLAGSAGEALSRSLRISNRRFREATGWAPSVLNMRAGLAKVADSLPAAERVRVPGAVKAGLWALALFFLLAGIQQQFAPQVFYDGFPGFGMQWVSVDGPYNEHLLRDLGGANLALAVVTLYAISRPSAGLVRAVAAAALVAYVPHFVYHAAHLDLLATQAGRVLQTAALALTVVIPLIVLLGAGGFRNERVSPPSADADPAEREIGPPQRLIAPAR
jgi:nucleoside-diphosphate-sugar epimerase